MTFARIIRMRGGGREASNLAPWTLLAGALLAAISLGRATAFEERSEHFDRDPGWEGRNNRATAIAARTIRQDFGFSPATHHAGGAAAGELGGVITPAAEPAYYAKRIAPLTFRDRLRASGKLACGIGGAHVLVGFFNSATVNEWRTPNTVALRIMGRGERFYAYLDYATARWRAGGDEPRPFPRVRNPRSGKVVPRGFEAGDISYDWSLEYDPEAAGGRGAVTATIGGETSVCELAQGHQRDGATFDRFGVMIVSKSADSGGEMWLDDVVVNGSVDHFTTDPGWEGRGNRVRFETTNIRPRFDFGFSPSHFAGGTRGGELGGLVFRGDIRYPDRMASYGDRVGPLRLDRPLLARGTIALRRGVSDSSTLLGFYDSKKSLATNPSQASGLPEHFLGVMIDGPSREGFFVFPVYRTAGGCQQIADGDDRPRILPDGVVHRWELRYVPAAAPSGGAVTLTMDGRTARLDVPRGDLSTDVAFDRFGIVTTWIDGNAQTVYFDDLIYTASQ